MSQTGDQVSEADSDSSQTKSSAPLAAAPSKPTAGMTHLVLELVRPYRGWLIVVFVAMLFETAYDPTIGRVLIDGVAVTDYRLDRLREQIGFVLQDTVLFAGTIRENTASPGIG